MGLERWNDVPGWLNYEVSDKCRVRKKSTGDVLKQYRGQVRLSRNRYERTWRNVEILKVEAFGEPYIKPKAHDLSEPGEVWKRIEWQTDYMISNHKRVWSWKSLRFVGKRNGSGKIDVLFPDQTTMNVDRIYGLHFGFDIPCLPGEEWRRVDGDKGIQISNLGRIWSDYRCIIMKPQLCSGDRYYTVGDRTKVHRLVAMAFCPNADPANKTEVDHINEDRFDNRAVNLRWCTPEDNKRFYWDNHSISKA